MANISLMIQDEMSRRQISKRQASIQIGVSHTTLSRILDGEPYDVVTAEKIARWLNVPVSTLMNIRGNGPDALAAQIAALLHQEPKLAAVFGEAMERLLSGRMTQESFRELLAYAAFRLDIRPQEEGQAPEHADDETEQRSHAARFGPTSRLS